VRELEHLIVCDVRDPNVVVGVDGKTVGHAEKILAPTLQKFTRPGIPNLYRRTAFRLGPKWNFPLRECMKGENVTV
jgi:hypothetical protein